MERYKIRSAVFLILLKEENGQEKVLLQRRYNTGILDGQFDVSCGGHLEENETLRQAIIRETEEEIGILIKEENLKLSSLIHATVEDGNKYLFSVFYTRQYEGEPQIMEPNKCDQLMWCKIDELPDNIIQSRKLMIENYQSGNTYSEYGF